MKQYISYLPHKFGISGAIILLVFIFLLPRFSFSQCMTYPVSIEERISHSQIIVLGKLVQKHSYWDSEMKNIYTLNVINVSGFFKGNNGSTQIGIITPGGVVGNRAEIKHPGFEIEDYNEYIFFIQGENFKIADNNFKSLHPEILQVETYAHAQGAITKQFGKYHDLHSEPVHTEESIFKRITDITGLKFTSPSGILIDARPEEIKLQSKSTVLPITTVVPNITRAGTIAPADFITITGTGFGAAPGNVWYSNADDGGATLITSGVATDYISWAAGGTSINAKPARRAGTGPYQVNAIVSPSPLTVNYAHIEINSNFSGFGAVTRQRYYLVNKNGLGGYSFTYNSAFFANAPAVAAFGRAIDTWRCATFVNFQINAGTTAIASAVADNVNVIYFEPGLPAGVLGVCTTYYNGSATALCNAVNTVWWLNETDIQFRTIPAPGFTWNFGPAASVGTNYDFESVALHESGHSHGLSHIINFGQAMHYAISNGADLRTISVNDIAGGTDKMAYSTVPLCFIPATVTGPMIPFPSCVLGIQLNSFTGNCVNNKAKFNWSTSSETKNNFFTIEGSDDGINFEVIAKVKGAGYSKQNLNYSFEADANNKTYYRLKQTDFDGQSEYFNVISINCNKNSPEILIYPNPNTGIFTIKGADFNSEIVITNTLGEKVLVTKSNSNTTEIDLSFLSKGIYFVNLMPGCSSLLGNESLNKTKLTRKLVIQ